VPNEPEPAYPKKWIPQSEKRNRNRNPTLELDKRREQEPFASLQKNSTYPFTHTFADIKDFVNFLLGPSYLPFLSPRIQDVYLWKKTSNGA
jgi:hypothetical protein